MKLIKKFVWLALLSAGLAGAPQVQAFTTLSFTQEFVNGIASGFGDEGGVAKNGMLYGVIVSTTDSTFLGGQYDPIGASIMTNGGFLSVGGVVTDDYYHPGAGAGGTAIPGVGLTYNSSGDMEGDFTTAGGNGTIANVSNVPIFPDQPGSSITAGDAFSLIWFANNTAEEGDAYGMFTHASFSMPASGTVDFSTPFLGTDSVRSAQHEFGIVPEPSRMLLLGMALTGMLFRRRR